SDEAWKHGISIDGDAKKIKCKYCDKVVTGGVYRLKHYLTETKKMLNLVWVFLMRLKRRCLILLLVCKKKKLVKKTRDFEKKIQSKDEGVEEEGDALVSEKRKGKEIETPTNLFKKKG
ncbi:hypothetical protein S83_012887, partial [Arachis hypogaea]